MISPPPTAIRLTSIQTLRGLAALLVVLTHLIGIEGNHSSDQILPNFIQLGISGVDLFFVISGFIMIWVSQDITSSGRQAARFLYARFTRIYPLYWVLALGLYLVWRIYPSITEYEHSTANALKSFLLWPDDTLPMLKIAWTLIHELYFYLVFSALLFLPKSRRLIGLSLWAILVVSGNLLGLGSFSPETALIFNPMGLEFFMGALAATLLLKFPQSTGIWALRIGIALWLSSLVFQSQFSDALIPSHWTRVFVFGVPATLIVYGCVAREKHGQLFSKLSQRIGDWSYSLYISHVLTLSALGYIWQKFAVEGAADNIIALSIMTVITIVVSGLLYYIVERPLLRLTKRLGRKIFKEKPTD